MSQQPHDAGDHGSPTHEVHEGPIKTPSQLVWTVVASFVVPVIIIILLVQLRDDAAGQGRRQRRPGRAGRGFPDPAGRYGRDPRRLGPAVLRTGEQVYTGPVRRLPRQWRRRAPPSSATPAPGRRA
jgi:hypothetical protein